MTNRFPSSLPFWVYLIGTTVFVVSILATPYLALRGDPLAPILYDDIFANICHQKISRSFCLFETPAGYHAGDCLPQTGAYREDSRLEKSAVRDGILGYKFPVSARDMFIYIGMLLGGLALLVLQRHSSQDLPPFVWFLLALVPIALDGTTQSLLFLRESTNVIRAATGFIAGFAVPLYAIPLLNRAFYKKGV